MNILNSEKLKIFPLSSETRQRHTFLPLSFNIVWKVLTKAIRQGKEIKGIQTGKEEEKQSLFSDDMVLYTENTKDATKKLLDLNKFGNLSGYKIYTQKYAAFLYTSNKLSERN